MSTTIKTDKLVDRVFTVTFTPKVNSEVKAKLIFFNHKGKKHPNDRVIFNKPMELKDEVCEVKYEVNNRRYKWTDLSWTTNLDECEQHWTDWRYTYYPNDVAYNVKINREKKYIIYYQVVEIKQQTLMVVN